MYSGEKAYSCSICGIHYSEHCHLQMHMNLHNDDNSHNCSCCGMTFSLGSTLAAHIKLHQMEEDKNGIQSTSDMESAGDRLDQVKHKVSGVEAEMVKCNQDSLELESNCMKECLKIHLGETSARDCLPGDPVNHKYDNRSFICHGGHDDKGPTQSSDLEPEQSSSKHALLKSVMKNENVTPFGNSQSFKIQENQSDTEDEGPIDCSKSGKRMKDGEISLSDNKVTSDNKIKEREGILDCRDNKEAMNQMGDGNFIVRRKNEDFANSITREDKSKTDTHEEVCLLDGSELLKQNECFESGGENGEEEMKGVELVNSDSGQEPKSDEDVVYVDTKPGMKLPMPYQYQCSECSLAFRVPSLLKKHQRTHKNIKKEKPYECSMCPKTFCCCSNLVAHIRTHTGERPYRCSVCGMSFGKNSTLTRHMKCHTGEKPHVCEVCDKAFIQKCQLTVHMRTHTGDKPYICSVCQKSFCVKDQLTTHMTTHEEGRNRCPICGETFSQKRILNQHVRTHNGETNPSVCIDPVTKVRLPVPKKKPFRCSECDAAFRTPSSLNIHVRSHTGEKPFQCPICLTSFSISSNLKSHMKTHSEDRPFKCPVCDKGFIKNQDMKRHLRSHTGEKPHTCSVCGKSFSQRSILKTHMKTHSGVRPYQCSICARQFCQRSQLQNHMRVHEENRPFTCNLCGKNFRENGTYESHMRIHTGEKPYKCSVCSKTFRQSGYLQKHMRSHAGENPHKCLICFSSYFTVYTLQRHMKVHSCERPYRCLACNWEFGSSHLLKQHMKMHTTEGTGLKTLSSQSGVEQFSKFDAAESGASLLQSFNEQNVIKNLSADAYALPSQGFSRHFTDPGPSDLNSHLLLGYSNQLNLNDSSSLQMYGQPSLVQTHAYDQHLEAAAQAAHSTSFPLDGSNQRQAKTLCSPQNPDACPSSSFNEQLTLNNLLPQTS